MDSSGWGVKAAATSAGLDVATPEVSVEDCRHAGLQSPKAGFLAAANLVVVLLPLARELSHARQSPQPEAAPTAVPA